MSGRLIEVVVREDFDCVKGWSCKYKNMSVPLYMKKKSEKFAL